jgi:hypothetical protein
MADQIYGDKTLTSATRAGGPDQITSKTPNNLPALQPVTYVDPQQEFYMPSDMEKQVVRETFFKFRWTQDMRNRAYEYMDNRTLIEYIDDSVKRFTTNIFSREGLEDWQARVHDPFTRNKVLEVLGRIVSVLPIASFMPRGDEDILRADILNNLYSYSEEKDNFEEFMTQYLLEAIVKGTAVGYEGMEYHVRKVRDVKGVGDDITVTEDEIKETKLFAEIVPLEEFYPAHVGIRTIKQMPFCFWRREISYDEFKANWQMYERYVHVKPHAPLSQWREQRPFYLDYVSTTVQPGNVEIVRLYDKINDVYVILANGVWLNPIVGKGDKELVSPLPWNHKELPFFDAKFDFFGNWFYGKSLPDRLQSFQDVMDVLTNMVLDQSFLTIFPPLLTAGNDAIEDDYLRPGRRTPIDTQGLPLNQAYAKLDLGAPSGWHEFILNWTKGVLEESSVNIAGQGMGGTGNRVTAQEVGVAQQGVQALMSIFGRMINYALKQKAMLRGANILQFWTDPNTPMLQGVLGDTADEDFKKAFNLIKVDGTTLASGKRGTKVIAMYQGQENMPTQQTLKAKAVVKQAMNPGGRPVEYVAVDAAYLRNIEFNVKLIMDQKKDQTKDLEKALQLEKIRVYMTFFGSQVDTQELLAQTAEKFGDDPSKVMAKQQQPGQQGQPQPGQPGQKGQPGQGAPGGQNIGTKPQFNITGNMTNTGLGVNGGMQNMGELMGTGQVTNNK